MTFRIFISDKMSADGLENFTGHEGFEVHYDPEVTMDDLGQQIGEFDALVIRSRTQVTREMLANSGKLKIIGRAGAGVDNVDLEAATEKGIIVMNTPGGNTVSTAEHAMAMMMSLARRIPFAHATMREGKWDKKSIVGVELAGKTLGILGLGKIGRVVASRMQAFEMDILAYDPFLTNETAEKLGVTNADVDTICEKADFITIHCPLNDDTRGLIGTERLAKMKPTTLLINCARGGIVDEAALVEALQNKTIAGAALDVFSAEPLPADSPLRSAPSLVLTPHLAASTNEAQEKVAGQIAVQIREALSGDMIRNAVNAPSVDAKTYAQLRPALDLCERLGRFAAQFAPKAVKQVEITYLGTKAQAPSDPLTIAVMKGFLKGNMSEKVNEVNAMYLARQLGIRVSETRCEELTGTYAGMVVLRTTSDNGQVHEISGTLNIANQAQLINIDGKTVDSTPAGHMIVLENNDVPGIIGIVGTILGNHKINIASMSWGRVKEGGEALTVINIDQPIDPSVLEELRASEHVLSAVKIIV